MFLKKKMAPFKHDKGDAMLDSTQLASGVDIRTIYMYDLYYHAAVLDRTSSF